jgi:hypothetical protein
MKHKLKKLWERSKKIFVIGTVFGLIFGAFLLHSSWRPSDFVSSIFEHFLFIPTEVAIFLFDSVIYFFCKSCGTLLDDNSPLWTEIGTILVFAFYHGFVFVLIKEFLMKMKALISFKS